MIRMEGKPVANALKEKLKLQIAQMDIKPKLAVILIGDDFASSVYVRNKNRACEELGIEYEEYDLDSNITQKEVLELIDKLNKDNTVHGILVQSPVPEHLDITDIFNHISPEKDVDGFNPLNVGKLCQGQDSFIPCTPLGIMHMLEYYNIDVSGKNCVILGRSNIVGKPMAQLLLKANGTVTICHSKTNNLVEKTQNADILIVAIGQANFIKANMIKENAIVIDVGINRPFSSKKVVGDVDFIDVQDKCSFITPVPGGVGVMTITTLMENVVKARNNLVLNPS